MKIINKILAALVALPIVAGLASCSEKEAEYLPAPIIAGQEVYIPSTANTTINLTPGTETKAEAYFDICRVKSEGEVTVPLKVTSSSEKYKVANEVKFENGSKVGKMVITYDPTQLVPGEFDTISVTISDPAYTTPYGKSSAVLLIGQPEPWVSLGWGTFNETFFFGIENMDVEIFQNELSPNTYRIKNPFTETVIGWGESLSYNVSEYLYFKVLKAGDKLFDQTIPEDGFVYFYSDYTANSLNTGYTYSTYSDDVCIVYPGAFTALRDPSYWTCNYVIAEKEDRTPGAIQLAPYYYMFNTGGWNQTQNNGVITIVMPGFTLSDYSADIEYKGKFIGLDNVITAVTNVTLGADVASAKIGMYPGKASNDGLTYVMNNGQEINAGGEYKIAFPEGAESGTYTVYVVSFDGDGNAQEYGYGEFKYEAQGSVEDTWTPLYVGTWEYSLNAFCNEDGSPAYKEGLVLSVCDQDETMYKISNLWNGVDFIFTLNGDNTLSFEDQKTGADFGYDSGEVMVCDLSTYEGYEELIGYIDDEGVFHFSIYYHDNDYSWGYGYETFTLTGKYEASAAAKKASAKRNVAKRAPKTSRNVVELGTRASSCKISNGVKAIKLTKETVR